MVEINPDHVVLVGLIQLKQNRVRQRLRNAQLKHVLVGVNGVDGVFVRPNVSKKVELVKIN